MSVSLASPGNGVNPREDIAGGKTYFDFSPVTIVPAVGPIVLAAADCGKLITNAGAVGAASARAVTLPPIPATGSIWFRFYDSTGLGLQINADGIHTIRVGPGSAGLSATGGNIVSQLRGELICLRNVSNSEWVADPTMDDWQIN